MRERPQWPSFHPLPRTSPALNEVLRTCFLRAAFQSDDQFLDVRSLSTASALGSVSHRLLEEAARGKFDGVIGADLDRLVAARWAELVGLEEQAMKERAHGPVPAHNRWPKYALRKATACRAASRIASHRGPGVLETAASAVEPRPVQTEVWYEGLNGRLAGRIDLVRRTSAGIELIDYKSGSVTEQERTTGVANRIREPYERQMLLYSALIHENEGLWPSKTTVESLIQGPCEVQLSPDSAQAVVEEALDLLEAYNRKAALGTVRGKPSDSVCRWCNFKAICRDFLEAAEASWEGPLVTVIGRLTFVSLVPPWFFLLDVTGGDHPKDTVTVRGAPLRVARELRGLEGATLSFGGLRRTLGSNDLLFDWTSQVWKWTAANWD